MHDPFEAAISATQFRWNLTPLLHYPLGPNNSVQAYSMPADEWALKWAMYRRRPPVDQDPEWLDDPRPAFHADGAWFICE